MRQNLFLNLTDQNNIQKITETWIIIIFNIQTVFIDIDAMLKQELSI